MMIWPFIFLLVFLTAPVQAQEKKFVESWKRYDEFLSSADDTTVKYREKMSLPFSSLPPYTGEVVKPPEITGEIENALVLWSQAEAKVLIVTPQNIMKQMTLLNEEYKQKLKQCRDDRSWIVVLPENRWTEVELNPYCTMHYGEEQISIDLYWAGYSKKPFIDIVSNALTCVPHQLFGWDRRMHAYVQKSSKCTGNRPFENFTGTDPQPRQVYPPLGTAK